MAGISGLLGGSILYFGLTQIVCVFKSSKISKLNFLSNFFREPSISVLAIFWKSFISLPISTLVEDFYGVNDVYTSLPSIINKNGVRETLKIVLNDEEIKDFKNSANKLKDIIRKVGLS